MSTKQQQNNESLANERIDAAVDKLLKAAGSALRHYMPSTVIDMRETMRGIMSESYIKGSNDAKKVLFYAQAEVERLERYGEQDMQSKAKREAERVLTSREDD